MNSSFSSAREAADALPISIKSDGDIAALDEWWTKAKPLSAAWEPELQDIIQNFTSSLQLPKSQIPAALAMFPSKDLPAHVRTIIREEERNIATWQLVVLQKLMYIKNKLYEI